jgi:hypothetical protein
VLLPGFQHRPGVHCGSTALSNALRVRGLDLSEPMAFGLGAGLGFECLHHPAGTPSHLLLGRTPALERHACEVLGAPVVERKAKDAAEALAGVRAALGRGLAPILFTELSLLPYWHARTPFGGHRVVLAGMDGERGVAVLADTGWPGLQEVTLIELEAARAAVAPPLATGGRPWLEVEAPPRQRPLAEAVLDALRRQAHDLLKPPDGQGGIPVLERFAAELAEWPERAIDDDDLARCFRAAYQVIEVRGTGGGLFRRLYARFLREVERVVPGLSASRLPGRMEALAVQWRRLAEELRRLGEHRARTVPIEVVAQVRALGEGERRFFEEMAAQVQ